MTQGKNLAGLCGRKVTVKRHSDDGWRHIICTESLFLGRFSSLPGRESTGPRPLMLNRGRNVVTSCTEPDGEPLTQPLAKKRVRVLGSFGEGRLPGTRR